MAKLISSIKNLLAAALVVLLLACASSPAYAAPAVDVTASCALTVRCAYASAPLSGVGVRVYRAADTDAAMRFTLAPAFSGSGVTVAGLTAAAQWSDAAAALAKYAAANALTPEHSGKTDAAGALSLAALTPGLYLVVTEAYTDNRGTYSAAPSLVALPGVDAVDDTLEYSVSVSPKLAFTAASTPSPAPTPTPASVPGSVYPYGRLPQTGQLNWPVPALALTGLALVAAGVWLTRRKTHGG